TKVKDLVPAVEQAFDESLRGVPGPVFVECPVDLLYGSDTVREWYGAKSGGRSLPEKALSLYVKRHVDQMFEGADEVSVQPPKGGAERLPARRSVERAAELLRGAERPVILVGSQAVVDARAVTSVAASLERIGAPVYL